MDTCRFTSLHILQVVASSSGGAATHVLTLARGLKRDLFSVQILISADSGNVLLDDFAKLGIPCATIHLESRFPWRGFIDLRRSMRESNFDVVHAHGLRAGFLVRAAALAIRKPPQIVYSIHGLHFAYYRSFWPKLLLVLAERLLKRQTSLWLCASESDAANALKFRIAYPGRVHVVVNAVDALTFQEHADLGSDFRLELGMAAHEKLLTTVARLHRQKDLPTLLHAMRHVRSNINNVRLAIVGDGPETSKLRELCSQLALDRCVSFMGMRRDVPRILAATDIFLLATHWEATSIALLEAMAAGKPVIASNVDGVREVVVPEVTGILVQPENAGALAEAACRLLRDPALAQRMGQAGRQRVQQDFSPQKLWSRVEGFYLKSKI